MPLAMPLAGWHVSLLEEATLLPVLPAVTCNGHRNSSSAVIEHLHPRMSCFAMN